MKLLYVAEGMPNRDPARGDGSSLIPLEVIRALPEDITVTLLTFRGNVPLPAEVDRRCAAVELLPQRSRRLALARSVLSSSHIGAEQRMTAAARSAVDRLSAEADVTLVHGPHAAPLAHAVRGPLVLQVVDPWSLRVGMEVELATGLRRLYRAHKARQALAAERALPARARLLTVGQRDADAWSRQLGRPVRAIPNGVQAAVSRVRVPGPPTVCFVGSLHYEPNIEAATVLVQEIAPQVWAEAPETRFLLAGRQPTAAVLALAGDRVEVRANVPSMLDVFSRADVAVFPDRHGLGIRNSVSEALSAGLPVVATQAGAREQQPHPLLQVVESETDLVERVLKALASAATPDAPTCPATPGGRSWAAVAADYLAECRAAIATAQ